jgi:aspartyl/asparaginyl-tRNA synthetase
VRPSAASARFFSSAKQVLSIATVFESAASAAASARLPVSHTVSSLPDVTFASMHAHRVAGDDAASAEGSSVTVSGWVRTCRGQKNDVFLVLNDGTNVAGMQVICSTDLLSADVVAASRALTAGASVTVSGRLARNERQPLDSAEAYEVHATALTVWSVCPANAAAAAEQVGVPIEAVSAAVDADAAAAAAAAEAKQAKKTKKKQKGPDGAAADPGVAPSAAVAAEPLEVSCELPVTPYPLQKKVQSISFLRDHPHLRMRTNTYAAVFRVRSEVRCSCRLLSAR